jgi:hyperosmotically inducible protein
MKTINIALMLVLGVPSVIGASACATTRMAGEQTDDARISGRVGRRLTLDPDVKRYTIDVDTIDGVVTLRGKVDSETMKTSAEKLARDTEGVKDVKNELIVDPTSFGESISEGTKDSVLKTKVGTRLTTAPDIDRINIDVDVQDGVVTLSGVVHDENAKQRAEEVARSTEGVKDVKNELTVNPDDQRLRDDTDAEGHRESGSSTKEPTPENSQQSGGASDKGTTPKTSTTKTQPD